MAHIDHQYNKLAEAVLKDGFRYNDSSRNNMEMLEIPHHTLEIDITKGFPLLTTKKIFYNSVIHELIWMLSGSKYIDYLISNGVNIWTKDTYSFYLRRFNENVTKIFNIQPLTFEDFKEEIKKKDHGLGFVGPIYGSQWRNWNDSIDQIKNLLRDAEENLYSRRLLVTAWNPSDLPKMALPPCHWAFQLFPTKDGFGLKWHQRSCDVLLGIPFDIALYATLGKLIEAKLNLKFTTLVGDLSCVHFYGPHVEKIKEQLERPIIDNECDLVLNPDIDVLLPRYEHFELINYKSNKPLKAEMYAKDENFKN